jgi:hypothetical protein
MNNKTKITLNGSNAKYTMTLSLSLSLSSCKLEEGFGAYGQCLCPTVINY